MDKKLFKEIIKKDNPIILDVGCYDGSDSVDFLDLYKEPKIHCFEIDNRSIELFKKNPKTDKLNLHKTAISSIDGEIEWFPSDSDTRRHYEGQKSWSASSSLKKPKNHLKIFGDVFYKDSIRVTSMKLDTWVEKNKIKEIDLIWVDVNGAEEEFINGGLNTLNNKTKYLFMEFSEVELFEGQINLDGILEMLPNFKKIDIFDFHGNFGNVLLKNISING